MEFDITGRRKFELAMQDVEDKEIELEKIDTEAWHEICQMYGGKSNDW